MADPISVIGLVQQVGILVKQLYEYGRQVKSARSDINNLCGDLLALKGILEDLKDHRADPPDQDRLAVILSKASVLLSDLLQQLEPGLKWHRRMKQSLQWPFTKIKVDEILTNLERVKTALLLALMGDYQSALADISNIKNDVSTIKGDVQGIREIVSDEASLRLRQKDHESREKLYERIAPVSPVATHKKARAVWQGTESGSWFVKGPLDAWLNDPKADAQLMALCGVSGAGKSTIISRAIDDLATNTQAMPVAYFYCTYNEVATHEVGSVLGSWLVQLSRETESEELVKFERYVDQDGEIPTEALEAALASIAEARGPILLILDALNESTHPQKLLASMYNVIKRSKRIRCLVSTTFPAGGTLERLACPYVRVAMSADLIKDDVTRYVRRTVATHELLRAVGEERILGAIVPHTQAMFRWASCQMEILSGYVTVKMVRRALNELPGSLEDIYVMLLQRVPPLLKDVVRDALLWLTYSIRPLLLSELIEAIAIEVGEKSIDDTCRILPHHRIFDLCQGLVVWDEDVDEVSLAHSSVATFLQSEFIRSSSVAYFAVHGRDAVLSILQKSLSYMLMDEFQSGPCSLYTLARRYEKYPLLDYASTTWALHTMQYVRIHGELGEAEVHTILSLFWTHRTLPSGGNFAFWVQCLLPRSPISVIQEATPLYYASSFGLTPIVAMMFKHGQIEVRDPRAPWYIDKPCGRGSATALNVACYRRHLDVVRILLAHGAQPNLVDRFGVSGRTWARVGGSNAIARLMRDNGGLEKDLQGYISTSIYDGYSVDDEADITRDDRPGSMELPYNGIFKFIRRRKLKPGQLQA